MKMGDVVYRGELTFMLSITERNQRRQNVLLEEMILPLELLLWGGGGGGVLGGGDENIQDRYNHSHGKVCKVHDLNLLVERDIDIIAN